MAIGKEGESIQGFRETLDNPLTVPAHKLDADQYSADDLDGVTESIFGSGNMAYASLQSSQTGAAMDVSQVGSPDSNTMFDFGGGNSNTLRAAPDNHPIDTGFDNRGNDDFSIDTDKTIDTQDNFNTPNGNGGGNGNFASSTVGSVSASELSSNQGTFANPGSGLSLQEGLNGENGNDGQDGVTPDSPESPQNGTDGKDGTDGSGKNTNIEINFGGININTENVTEVIDQTFINLGDTIDTLTISITDITQTIGDTVTNLDINNILDVTQITNLVNNLTVNLSKTINTTVTNITETTNIITNVIETVVKGNGDLSLDLDLNILDTGLVDVTVPFKAILDTDVNLDVNLSPTVNFINNIADLSGLDILSDSLAKLGGKVAVLQTTIDQVADIVSNLDLNDLGATIGDITDSLGDLDQAVGDIPQLIDDAVGGILDQVGIDGDDSEEGLISQTVDPVVADITDVVDDLTGEGVDAVTDSLAETVDTVTDITDGLTSGITAPLLGVQNDNENGTDTDVAIDLGLGAEEENAADDLIEVALDPVEDLAGDLDLSIDTTVLGDGEIDNNAGDQDINIQTNIDLVDNTIIEEGLDIPLDPVEAVAGDIDLDIDLAKDLLGQQADPLTDNADGGTGEETVLADLGDGLGDLTGGLVNGDSGQINDGASQTLEAGTATADDAVENVDNLAEELGLSEYDNDEEGLISQTDDPVVADITDVVDDLTGGGLDAVTDAINETNDAVTDIADAVSGGLTDTLLGETNDNANGTDSDLTADAGIDILDHTIVDPVLDVAVDPVEDLVGDLDIDLNAATDLLNNDAIDNDEGDSDIVVATDVELIDTELLGGTGDIHLDPVEQITGDLDVDTDIATDLLNDTADPLINSGEGGTGEDTILAEVGDAVSDTVETVVPGLNAGDNAEEDLSIDTNIDILDENLADTDIGSVPDPVEEIAGDIDTALNVETDLLNNAETSNDTGDSDLTSDIDIDLAGQDLLDAELDVPLDAVEDITGDIDLDITSALDLLNSDNSENLNNDAPSDGDINWTENTITDGGGLFGDIVNGTDGLDDALPDPTGTIAEGIGVLDVEPELNVGNLGGLFG